MPLKGLLNHLFLMMNKLGIYRTAISLTIFETNLFLYFESA